MQKPTIHGDIKVTAAPPPSQQVVYVPVKGTHRTKLALLLAFIFYFAFMFVYVHWWQFRVGNPTGTWYNFANATLNCTSVGKLNDRCFAQAIGMGDYVGVTQWKSFDLLIPIPLMDAIYCWAVALALISIGLVKRFSKYRRKLLSIGGVMFWAGVLALIIDVILLRKNYNAAVDLPIFRTLFGSLPVSSTDFGNLWPLHFQWLLVVHVSTLLVFIGCWLSLKKYPQGAVKVAQ